MRIKTSSEDFLAAVSNGYIYGVLILVDNQKPPKNFPVYAELGSEGVYRRSYKDDPKTDYKIFFDCAVFLADTYDNLLEGKYLGEDDGIVVIIYC